MKNPEELLQKIKQLERELKQVKSCKRYGLVWEDKPEIFEEKAKNALPILKEDKSLRIEETEEKPNNIIIEGDNFHSLSALSYTHKGKIDVIYIDPPYNTGNKDFIYNDSFVDKEDSYRHSKWLSFMNKRLKLAKELLSDNGLIFLSIDDNEFAQLKLLCDELLGPENFISSVIWRKKYGGGKGSNYFVDLHEYIYVYAKNILNINTFNIPRTLKQKEIFKLSDEYENERGKYYIRPLKSGLGLRKTLIYPIKCPDGSYVETQWICAEKTYENLLREGRIVYKKLKTGKYNIYKKFYENDSGDGVLPESIFYDLTYNQNGKEDIKKIFNISEGRDIPFENPKPKELISYLINLSCKNKNAVILDFFAGSGTTGHAVMELNKEDSGNRQFILCSSRENTKEEQEKNICRDITYERNKRVIQGYKNAKGEKIEGLGGNLRYYKTEFIKADKSIDDLRYSFIDMCDDLLCIKENTFNEVKLKKSVPELRLFKKAKNYTAILYDIHHFEDLKKMLDVLDGQIAVYIFSLSKDIFEEELEHFKNVKVQNIPDDILTTYNKIFNF